MTVYIMLSMISLVVSAFTEGHLLFLAHLSQTHLRGSLVDRVCCELVQLKSVVG